MKITIINSERKEKRYTRMELDEFVGQLSEGTLRPASYHAPMKEVCFAAEWQKLNGELKTKEVNCLVLLSLENLRVWPPSNPTPCSASSATTATHSTSSANMQLKTGN